MLLRSVRRTTTTLVQASLMLALPAGGQLTARRNAWASMSNDAARARGRRDAEHALHESRARHAFPVASAR